MPSRFSSGGGGSGDPFFADVFSLLPMSGTDGSTTFTDQIAGRVWTPTGDAEISTAESPFSGGSSGSFGTGYLTTGTANDWAFLHTGSTSWTIDIWTYVNALGANRALFGTNKGSSANTGVSAWIDSTGHLHVLMSGPSGTTVVNFVSSSAVVAAGAWYLVSVQLNIAGPAGAKPIEPFVNGTQLGSLNCATFPGGFPSFPLNIAAFGGGAIATADGFRAQWRVTKALRYSGDFTPPTGPWPTSA